MRWALFVFSMLAIITGFVFAYFEDHQALWAGIFVGMFFMLVAHLDRIESFKLSTKSIEARTRDVIAKAESTLSELQILAQYVAEISLSLVKRQGRLGGYEDGEENQIKDNILSILQKIGINNNSIPQVLKEWNHIIEFDYSHFILGGSVIPDTQVQDKITRWKTLRAGGFANVPSPEGIRQFLAETGLTNEGIEDYLLDYEYFRQHRRHRRPDVWRERNKWGRLREPN